MLQMYVIYCTRTVNVCIHLCMLALGLTDAADHQHGDAQTVSLEPRQGHVWDAARDKGRASMLG